MTTATKPARGMNLTLAGAFKPSEHRRRPNGGRYAIRPQLLELEDRCLLSSGPVLYAINNTYAEPHGNATLYTIDPSTGISSPVATITPTDGNPFPDYLVGMALDPVTNDLYAITGYDSNTGANSYLYTINRTTGQSTRIAMLSQNIAETGDLAFSPSGTLYGITNFDGQVYTVNPITGQVSMPGPPLESAQNQLPGKCCIASGNADYQYMTYYNGYLWAIDTGSGTIIVNNYSYGAYTDLVKIDPTTGGFTATSGTVNVFPLHSITGGLALLGQNGGMTVDAQSGLAYIGETVESSQPNGSSLDGLYTLDLKHVNSGSTLYGVGDPSIFPFLDSLAYYPNSADLALTKTAAPNKVAPGDTLTYTLKVTNNGPDPATGVTLSDPLPTDTTFQSITGLPAGWNETDPGVGHSGTVVCTDMSDFAANAPPVTIVITVTVDPTAVVGSVITNAAVVGSSADDPNPLNNTASATTPVVAGSADLAITKTATPDPVLAGGTLTYTLTVTNNGPDASNSVVVTDTLPGGITFAGFTTSSGWNVNINNNFTFFQFTTPTLADNASATLVITVTVDPSAVPGTIITNTAFVGSNSTADPNRLNNAGNATTLVGCTNAVPLPVFGTGLNASGGLLSTTPNNPMPMDQHYTLVPPQADTPPSPTHTRFPQRMWSTAAHTSFPRTSPTARHRSGSRPIRPGMTRTTPARPVAITITEPRSSWRRVSTHERWRLRGIGRPIMVA